MGSFTLPWEHILWGFAVDHHEPIPHQSLRNRLQQYETDTLKLMARQCAQQQGEIDLMLQLLDLPSPERPVWTSVVLPELQRIIEERETPQPARTYDKPELLETVQRVVQVRRRGKQYWGLCPFHDDTDASFTVNPETQKWRCWGACQAWGDSLDFLARWRNGQRTPG